MVAYIWGNVWEKTREDTYDYDEIAGKLWKEGKIRIMSSTVRTGNLILNRQAIIINPGCDI